MGTGCKPVGYAYLGSNPRAPTILNLQAPRLSGLGAFCLGRKSILRVLSNSLSYACPGALRESMLRLTKRDGCLAGTIMASETLRLFCWWFNLACFRWLWRVYVGRSHELIAEALCIRF